MAWCNDSNDDDRSIHMISSPSRQKEQFYSKVSGFRASITCPSCGHEFEVHQDQTTGIHDLPGLPAGVKFDPSDQEILEHLEAKINSHTRKLHPLIDEFIPTIEGENGICYTHPERLPGVQKDGQIRHFFHRPSKAYTTGTRKRRKVNTDGDGSGETRWHKTGKTRAVIVGGAARGFKKILVLYTNYGRQRKPEKTNWVMHQYHLGDEEGERDGELVVSKVFYQTQPRQPGSSTVKDHHHQLRPLVDSYDETIVGPMAKRIRFVEYYGEPTTSFASYDVARTQNEEDPHDHQLFQGFAVHSDSSSFINLPTNSGNPGTSK